MPSAEYSPELRSQLLGIARDSMTHGVHNALPLAVDLEALPPPLTRIRASFVTLRLDDELRGCTGTLEASLPLAMDVAQTACSAALSDPRFFPVTPGEVDAVSVGISVLSPLTPMNVAGEEDLLRQLIPEIDGLVLSMGRFRATFLPKVWEQLPEPRAFVRELKRKAGLPAEFWSPELSLYRYHTEDFAEAS
jgi:AmmeMemoRadiSam system protein A